MITKNIFNRIALLLITVLFFTSTTAVRAEAGSPPKKQVTGLNLLYVKNSNETRSFTATLSYVENRETNPVRKVKIRFFSGKENKKDLAELLTDRNGKAILTLPKETHLDKDPDGFYYISAEFSGNEAFEAGQNETKFQDMHMILNLGEADSTKSMLVKAYTLNDKGEEVPLKDLGVNFYVARMFSYLKVGDATLDEAGKCKFDFPESLAGDSLGNLILIARVDENETYGNVEARQSARWGRPTLDIVPSINRTLWTQIAPTWMIITLIVLLSGVWGHYFFAIYKIFKIKKAGNPDKEIRI